MPEKMMPSSEGMAQIRKEQILSDAELIKGGADIKPNGEIKITDEQMQDAKIEMNESKMMEGLEENMYRLNKSTSPESFESIILSNHYVIDYLAKMEAVKQYKKNNPDYDGDDYDIKFKPDFEIYFKQALESAKEKFKSQMSGIISKNIDRYLESYYKEEQIEKIILNF